MIIPARAFQSPPKVPWNQRFDYRQGGTFKGITGRLDYLRDLGVKALWLSPILKNPRPDWQYNYHGYDTQDFLSIDERFGSDGTLPTAERELKELIERNGFGEVTVTKRKRNENSGNDVRVYLWTMDKKYLNADLSKLK